MRCLHQCLVALYVISPTSVSALPRAVQAILGVQDAEEALTVGRQAEQHSPQRIAIIGSGITGAATAYNIYEKARLEPRALPEITVFERKSIIGGRFTQAFALDSPRFPVDTCAATFSSQDVCIATSAQSVGLVTQPFNTPRSGTGVWDGKGFVGFIEEDDFRNPNAWNFFRRLKWYQRYGNAPQNFFNAVTLARQAFTLLVNPSVQQPEPVRNLRKAVEDRNLGDTIRYSICTSNGTINCTVDDKTKLFVSEVFNAGIRERYFADGNVLNGLEELFGYESEAPLIVAGGNLRLIDRLLVLSRAKVLLSSTVTEVGESPQGGRRVRYRRQQVEGDIEQDFDVVVLATSLSLANITFSPPLPEQPGLEQLYNNSYVTHFTTSSTLNATYFGLELGEGPGMTQNVLTSPLCDDIKPPFYSLTFLRILADSDLTERPQNLYKIVSDQRIEDEALAAYLQAPEDITEPLITWIDRQPLPMSVPKLPQVETQLLENIEIVPGIIYAGGGEQVAATAEFACRMGANAAELVGKR